jgi:hypothetical protein
MEGIKMKIEEKELKEINKKAKMRALENILTKDYPNAEIYVVRGFDRFSYEDYTKDAFFDEDKAYNAISKISPNGSPGLCDKYSIHTETPSSLREKPWDNVDRMMIYDDLNRNYNLGEKE